MLLTLLIEIYNDNSKLRAEQKYLKGMQFGEKRLTFRVKVVYRSCTNKAAIVVSRWLPFIQDKPHDFTH